MTLPEALVIVRAYAEQHRNDEWRTAMLLVCAAAEAGARELRDALREIRDEARDDDIRIRSFRFIYDAARAALKEPT